MKGITTMTVKCKDINYKCELIQLNDDNIDFKVFSDSSISCYKETISLSLLKNKNEGFCNFSNAAELINELKLVNDENQLNILEIPKLNDTGEYLLFYFDHVVHTRLAKKVYNLEIKLEVVQEELNIVKTIENILKDLNNQKVEHKNNLKTLELRCDFLEEKCEEIDYNLIEQKEENLNLLNSVLK